MSRPGRVQIPEGGGYSQQYRRWGSAKDERALGRVPAGRWVSIALLGLVPLGVGAGEPETTENCRKRTSLDGHMDMDGDESKEVKV